jgi:hypothetical protein
VWEAEGGAEASFSFAGKMSRLFLPLEVDVNGEELFVVHKVALSRVSCLFVLLLQIRCGSCFASAMDRGSPLLALVCGAL